LPDDRQPDGQEEQPGRRGFWNGTISFGLVSIPVALFPATRANRFSLRTLGKERAPLSRRYYARESEKALENQEMVRGYEVEGGEHVLVTDEELERLAPEKSRDIDLKLFVDQHSIPPIYYNRSYFLTPAGPSTKAYRLLAETMEKTGRAGIATFIMRGREYLVAIFAENKILLAETLRFADEIRSPADVGLPEKQKAPKELVRRFVKIIEKNSSDDLPRDQMHDERIQQLHKLVEKKRSRNEDVVQAPQEETKRAEVLDILTLLKQTLAKTQGEGGAERKSPPRKAPQKEHRAAPRAKAAKAVTKRRRTAAG
jgi:DNA end-binding protein Ku